LDVNTDYRILLVDDDEDILWANKMILSREGFTVDVSTDPEEALKKIRLEQFHIIIVDYMMPKIKGDDLANMIFALNKSVGIIFLTGYSEHAAYLKMVGNMDNLILFKPISSKELIDAVNSKIIQLQSELDSIDNTSANRIQVK
jgi:two-component system alkaline phosphatase synthesis response regulator PhoP